MTKNQFGKLEDDAQEVKHNSDGSVTFVFDEPYMAQLGVPATSTITISRQEMERLKKTDKFGELTVEELAAVENVISWTLMAWNRKFLYAPHTNKKLLGQVAEKLGIEPED